MEWVEIDKLPTSDDWPYTSYLVWLRGPKGLIKDGVAEIVQFDNRKMVFLPVQGRFDYCVMTHWMPLPGPPQ